MSEAATPARRLARQIWELFDAAQKRTCVAVVLISVIAACLTLAGVAGVAPFFAVLSDPTVVDRSAALAWLQRALATETPQDFLVWLGVGFVALLLLANLVNILAILSIARFSQNAGARFHTMLFDEYLSRDLRFHARANGAVLATRVIQDVNRTIGGIVQSGLTFVASTVTIALIGAAVIFVNPLIASAAALLLGSSYALTYAVVRRRLIRNGAIVTKHWATRAKVIAESFATIKDIILFRARTEMAQRVAHDSLAIAASQASTAAIAACPKYVLECVTGAGLIASALWIYSRSGAGQWMTQLAFLGFAAYRLLPAIQSAFAAFARIRTDRASFEGIADDLCRAHRRAAQRPVRGAVDQWHGLPRRVIRLVNVSYRHSSERIGGVDEVSLEIPTGALVGIVGPNGSGKTTLAELIVGLLQPDAGYVAVDGVKLDANSTAAWLNSVAYVPQEIVLLDATIAENIAFGENANDIDVERALKAADGAQLGPLIATLPDALATAVGENGAQLSGGQRQRVGIARALYRGASLLVMDEATSALDALTEAEVVALLTALRGTCTVVLITHRPSVLDNCDVVFELNAGRLVERRPFTELAPGSNVDRREQALR
jgi:ABC-type multidrug transport system fused ATPase/permease subunit